MPRVVLFNKPYGITSQFTGEDGLGAVLPVTGVYAAGRLDKDSEGLLLLTDDGKLQHRLTHPRSGKPKTYWVQVEGVPSDAALEHLRRGVELRDGVSLPAEVERLTEPDVWPRIPPIRYRASIPTSWLAITVTEGRNRQVRRMTAAVGHPTLRLIRYSIGDWTLDDLAPGEWREFTLNNTQDAQDSTGKHGLETKRYRRGSGRKYRSLPSRRGTRR